jgi:hypothetical protein
MGTTIATKADLQILRQETRTDLAGLSQELALLRKDLEIMSERLATREVLLPVDVPVPLGAAAHGPCAQLHHRRRAVALHAHAGPQRAAADGLGCLRPAGRERRDGQWRGAGEVDARQHRVHEEAVAGARLRDRLERELATCDPDYYRWNQWLFLRMLEKGIAYKKTGVVNWDPVDQTVLANEQVIDGRGWRTGALVEKREIPMYYLASRATPMSCWSASTRSATGPSACARCRPTGSAAAKASTLISPMPTTRARCWARRRAEGVHHARRHAAGRHLHCCDGGRASHRAGRGAREPATAAFIDECKRGSTMEADIATMEKKGRPHRPARDPSASPASRARDVGGQLRADGLRRGRGDGRAGARRARLRVRDEIRLPIRWSSLDERRLYDTSVVAPWQEAYAEHGVTVNSGAFSGLELPPAVDAIAAALARRRASASKRVQFRLRDWGISRQRYWGCPIPLIHCEACGDVPVPDEQLPVVLPEDLVPDGSGNPLGQDAPRSSVQMPEMRRPARRETDTMDTFVDSSWYFLRFACSRQRDGDGRRARAILAAGRPVHRRHRARDPAPALFALLDAVMRDLGW